MALHLFWSWTSRGGGGLTPLRRCSRHCWVHLTPSRGPPFVLVLDVPGVGGGVNSLKVVFQTLLRSPYAILWPSICFGLGRPRGGGGVNSLKAVFQTWLGSPYAILWPSICFGTHSVRRAAHSGSASQPLRTESRSQRLCTNGVISSTRCEHRLKLTNHMAWHVIDLYVSVRMLAIGQFVFRERIIYWGDPDLVRRSKQSRQNGGAQSTYICTAFLGVTGFIVALSMECWQW